MLLAAAMLTLALNSCSGKAEKDPPAEYIPVQESENGKWGMVGPDGKMLFSEEFDKDHAPTQALNGRFMVKNKDEMWEIYTAEAKPQKVGKEYKWATMFNTNGRALVTETNKHVSIIDKKGKTIKELDKLDGKRVDAVQQFSEGYAVFVTDKNYGVINDDGDVVIKPKYTYIWHCSDGKFLAIEKRFQSQYDSKLWTQIDYTVLDTKGNEILTLKHNRYYSLGVYFDDGNLTACVDRNGDKCWGIINEKGEDVVKPKEKIKNIIDVRGDLFVYSDGEGMGVMNMKGDVVVRAKYDRLMLPYGHDDRIYACDSVDGKAQWTLLDTEGNEVIKDPYMGIAFVGENYLVQESNNSWAVVDKDGKDVEGGADIYAVNFDWGNDWVFDDYLDVKALINELKFTPSGIDDLTLSSTPLQVIEHAEQNTFIGPMGDPSDPGLFLGTNQVMYGRYFGEAYGTMTVNFSGALSSPGPSGSVWNNVAPTWFELTFTNDGKLRGKLRPLVNGLKEYFAKQGTIVDQNDGAGIYAIGNYRAFVYMNPTSVLVVFGSVDNIDISQSADVKEDTDAPSGMTAAMPGR